MSLLVTGTIGIDTVYAGGEHREGVLGGSCTYFAAAASFYSPVRVVAAVGGDWPASHRAALSEFRGVDLSGLQQRPGSKTFRWGGRYSEDMNSRETLFTELGVLAEPPPPVPQAFRDSGLIFLANTHPAVQRGLLESVPRRRLVVADTMDLWIESARADLERLLREVDGLVLNYDEAEQFTGVRSTVSAARRILDFGPRFVIVKKGEHGCVLAHRDGLAALPAFPTERVVDPTGAGDSFAGGLMGFLARGDRDGSPASFDALRRALAHGTVMASFTIESFGPERLAVLTRDELDGRLAEFGRMLRVE